MSKKSDEFENAIVKMVNAHVGEQLPSELPDWMTIQGIFPSSKITKAEGIGSKNRMNKTDVIIHLSEGEPIKISAKLRNADYIGNWYGHERFIEEFGKIAFDRMTRSVTDWANNWALTATAPFVGVSICFGRRPGKTGVNFTDIFSSKDILTVARGYGSGESVANCMYISNHPAKTIPDLIAGLQEISADSVNKATETFKVIFRPINPLTERSNRGKMCTRASSRIINYQQRQL